MQGISVHNAPVIFSCYPISLHTDDLPTTVLLTKLMVQYEGALQV